MIKRVLKIISLTLTAIVVTLGAVNASAGTASAASSNGCPRGDVCMYTDWGWKHGQPEHEYYHYGVQELYGEYGHRYIYDNQYGKAVAYINKGADGSRTIDELFMFTFDRYWITPINSITLAG